MKIAVCVSHVPDTATKVKVGVDEKALTLPELLTS